MCVCVCVCARVCVNMHRCNSYFLLSLLGSLILTHTQIFSFPLIIISRTEVRFSQNAVMYAPSNPPNAWQVPQQQQQQQEQQEQQQWPEYPSSNGATNTTTALNTAYANYDSSVNVPDPGDAYAASAQSETTGASPNVNLHGGGHTPSRPSLTFALPAVVGSSDGVLRGIAEGAEEEENGKYNAEEDNAEAAREASRQHGLADDSPVETSEKTGKAWAHLHLHPILTSSSSSANHIARGDYAGMDPITAALARQQQQLYRGEPRSPLSPHTLKALCSASMEGRHHDYLAQLTPEDVLAPVPLALTWYPSVPSNVTLHADRKRAAASAMTRHEADRLVEERENEDAWEKTGLQGGEERMREEEGSGELNPQPRRRPRYESEEVSTSAEPIASFSALPVTAGSPSTMSFASPSALAAAQTLPHGDEEMTVRKREGGPASMSAEDDAWPSGPADAHRKREREEQVYEYITYGRRLN